MRSIRPNVLTLTFAVLSVTPSLAQPSTGTPPFGSFSGSPDVLNLGNLNSHWDIPIRNKAGRGTNFNYDLTYDSSIWYPVVSGSTTTWQPVNYWGWNGLSQAGQVGAYYSMTYLSGHCGPMGQYSYQSWTYGGLYYVDRYAVIHTFGGVGGSYIVSPGGSGCPPPGASPSGTLRSTDGNGMAVYFSMGQGQMNLGFVAKDGTSISPPIYINSSPSTTSYTSTDPNGNQISLSNGAFTDTLGQQALGITGTAPSNTLLSFVNNSGSSTYTVIYSPNNVKTNFGCAGIGEYSASSVYLVNSIELPDGRSYQFSYESTPGYTGYTTGRLLSVTLPTGGQIKYSYTGGSQGIECSDGSTSGLTRTTPDGTWTYSRSGSGTQWSTTVTAPAYNSVQDLTVIAFLTATSGTTTNFYEISRKLYSGSSTLLETVLHCYEASSSNCSSTIGDSGTTVSLPVAQVTTTNQWPNSSGRSAGTYDTYDASGNNTLHEVFDYASGGSYGSLLQAKTTTYSTSYSSYGLEVPTEVTVKDGSSNTITDTKYTYTSTVTTTSGTPSHVSGGPTTENLASVQNWVSGSTYQTKSYSYFDTGNVNTATDVNNEVTTYTYGGCGNSFPTSVSSTTGGSLVTSLGVSGTWNCNGGVLLTRVDPNNNTTTYAYGSDPYWRPTSVTSNATGASISFTYPSSSSNSSSSAMSFNGGSSTNTSVTTYDSLGRALVQQTLQAPGSTNYDTVATAYDSRGRVASQTVPYSGTLGDDAPVPTNPGTTTTYDALDRKTTVTDGGGGTTNYQYPANDVTVTIGPQVTTPSAENLKKRNLEYNGAGWLASVCEIVTSTLPAGGACAQSTSYNGYLTTYTYDGGGRLTQVKQNAQSGSTGAQTRTISYDGLNRKTSETIPEWSAGTGAAGTGTYTYDSSGSCSGTYTGDLVAFTDNMGNVTCYTYDLLHRPLSSKVVSGSYASVTPFAYYVFDSASYGTTSMQNAKGNLAEAYTCSGACSSKLTDEFFSIAAVTSGAMSGGVQAQMWESTPNSGGYFLTTDTYYPNGIVGATSALLGSSSIGIPNLTFGVDGEGRPYSASDGTHSLVTATSYNPASMPTQVTYGNSSTGSANDVDSFSYDPNTYRPTNLTYSINPSSNPYTVSTTLTWNANASLQKMVYTDGNDSTKNQTCTYSADDLSRMASVNCGSSTWAQNFTYDPFGNINKANAGNATTYAAAYSTATNQVSSGITPAPTYDKNGNQLTSTPASLTWNAWNVPISVNSTTATYDAQGRMVEKGSGSTYSQFVFRPSGAMLAVYSGSLTKGTVTLPGGNTAIYNSSGLNYLRHTDWLGSSRFATTWGHAVYSKEAYAPFGETYDEAGTADRSFTGQDQDVVTGSAGGGVYDFLFRKYDPSAGRWLSPDPSGWDATEPDDPQSLDRYAYVENQPLSLVDPTGLFSSVPCPVSVWAAGCDYPLQPPSGCSGYGSCQSGNPGNPGNPGNGGSGGGGGAPDHKPGPPQSRNCQGEANAAALQAVGDNFNEDFVGVNVVTVGAALQKGVSVAKIAGGILEGSVYTALWTGGKAATMGGMTMLVCTIQQVQSTINWIGSGAPGN